ncbi:MAG: 30S ribosomal protein S13 [Methanobacteriota archaeon]|nr:MAG: 30S ribosomal protein S13 [Euryarchaeota archaeon]|tara:strand:- start:7773 stop:8357 length:585 start_codon:yes stop_codon:yes gene_type:complete
MIFVLIENTYESRLSNRGGRWDAFETNRFTMRDEKLGIKMSKKTEDEIGEDFSYIVRLRNTDLDGLKRLSTALTSINGIGARTSATICRLSGLSPNQLTGNLTLEEQDLLRNTIDEYAMSAPLWMLNRQWDKESGEELHLFGQDLELTHKDDITKLRSIKTYRGIRHANRQKVRGQRGRSNGRGGLTLGVKKKK